MPCHRDMNMQAVMTCARLVWPLFIAMNADFQNGLMEMATE